MDAISKGGARIGTSPNAEERLFDGHSIVMLIFGPHAGNMADSPKRAPISGPRCGLGPQPLAKLVTADGIACQQESHRDNGHQEQQKADSNPEPHVPSNWDVPSQFPGAQGWRHGHTLSA